MRVHGALTTVILVFAVVLLLLLPSGHRSDAATQPLDLSLPWEGGTAWSYTQGPHGLAGGALDFQPPDAAGKPCDAFTSSYWVVAAADGEVISKPNAIEIDHGNGFRTGYFHIDDKQVTSGFVHAGDRLGHPGCCPDGWAEAGCSADAPHLHFYTSYEGERTSAVGLNLGGWVVQEDGCLERDGAAACPQSSIVSEAPQPKGAPPSLAADIVLVVQAPATDATRVNGALLAMLSVGRPDDRIAVVQSSGVVPLVRRLEAASPGGSLDPRFLEAATPSAAPPGDIDQALIRACQELIVEGVFDRRAVVVLTDGGELHPVSLPPCFGPSGSKLFLYDLAGLRIAELQLGADASPQFTALNPIGTPLCEFRRIRRLIGAEAPGDCHLYQIVADATVSLPLNVPPDQASMDVSIGWRLPPGETAGSFVPSIMLLSPDGSPADASSLSANASGGVERFTIENPEPGDWTLVISGGGAPPEGTYATVGYAIIAAPGPTPVPAPTEEAGEKPAPEEGTDATPTSSPVPSEVASPTTTPLEEPTVTPSQSPQPTGSPMVAGPTFTNGTPTATTTPPPVASP
jgi:hypothetical protein